MNMIKNLTRWATIVILAAGISIAHGQDYPNRPVKIVVAFAPGGPADVVGRLLVQQMSAELGQPVVIENRAGAEGIVGSQYVVGATPDGYTLLLTTSSLAINESVFAGKAPDAVNSLSHIGLVGTYYTALVVPANSPVTSVRELVEMLKANASRYNYSTPGMTGTLITELFHARTGLKGITRVSYSGNTPSVEAILKGDVNYAIASIASVLPLAKAGRLKILAVTSEQRDPGLPNVPTMAEAGVPDFVVGFWVSMHAPKGTPPGVVDKVSQALGKAVRSPELVEFSRRNPGFVLFGATGPDATREFVRKEVQRWAPIVKATGADRSP